MEFNQDTCPFLRIQVEVLHFAVFKVACKTNTVVSNVCFVSDHDDFVFISFCIIFEKFFSLPL
jgi:hypothetical protein